MDKYTLSVAGSSASLKWTTVKYTWSDFLERLNRDIRSTETMRDFDRLDRTARANLKDVGGYMAGRSGTAISAALEGVDARTSATKSEMVTSGSWPTAEITGSSDS